MSNMLRTLKRNVARERGLTKHIHPSRSIFGRERSRKRKAVEKK